MAIKSGVWRACLSDLLLAAGMLMLVGGTLLWARSALAAQEVANRRYLAASVPLAVPIPEQPGLTRLASGLPSPAPESPKKQPPLAEQSSSAASQESTPQTVLLTPNLPASPTSPALEPALTATSIPPEEAAVETAVSTPGDPILTPEATQTPTAEQPPAEVPLVESNPIIRIEIPSLKVKRAVVPVGLKPDGSGGMGWDTDAIFATNNRQDMVGHLVGSAYPGQGGNIILIGHNYNQVDYGWEGVFVNIKSLVPGDRIIIRGQDRREYVYIVQLVKKVPWRSKNGKELEKHLNYLGPSPEERLTLVTCGGANIWPFPARLYVVAIPEGK